MLSDAHGSAHTFPGAIVVGLVVLIVVVVILVSRRDKGN
jgi:hypothetical protein